MRTEIDKRLGLIIAGAFAIAALIGSVAGYASRTNDARHAYRDLALLQPPFSRAIGPVEYSAIGNHHEMQPPFKGTLTDCYSQGDGHDVDYVWCSYDAGRQSGYIVFDPRAEASSALHDIPAFTALGDDPKASCDSTCTYLAYDSRIGVIVGLRTLPDFVTAFVRRSAGVPKAAVQ